MRRFLAAAISSLAIAGAGYSQDLKAKLPAVEPAELNRLAEQLGDRDYRVREQAGKRLHELGADALPTLRKIAELENLEATERATDLIAKIEKQIANAKAIAGTPVELPAREQTLGAAFDTLREQTGYMVIVQGDQSPRSKKVTPKVGKVIFWEALNSLASAADLEFESAMATGPANVSAVFDPAKKGAPPIGSIVLRPKSGKASNPVCISGAFRIEAIPVPVANLPQMPADRVPVLLQLTPEPRLRWVSTAQTLVTLAKDQDGRSLSWDFVAADFNPYNVEYSGRRMGRGKGGSYYVGPIASPEFPATPFQAYLKLLAHPEGPSGTLSALGGKIRGRIWSQPETMLAITGLSETLQDVQGSSRTSLKAKYDPMPGDASALLLSVTTTYNSAEVIPHHGSSALNANPDGLWLENGPEGRVKVKFSPEERRLAMGFTNPYGLALVDGNGKPMNLSPHTTTQQSYYDSRDGSSTFAVTAQYVVRPATKDAESKPAKLAFNGTRIKTLEVPFQLKDVAVLRGTGTNLQNRSTYEIMER